MARTFLASALGIVLLAPAALAQEPPEMLRIGRLITESPPESPPQVAQADPDMRRRPGPPLPPTEPERVAPVMRPGAVPPPQPALPREFIPIPDRWRLVDALGITQEHWWDPYNQNTLKADKPIFGRDYFLNLELISDTVYEPRRVPTPTSFATTARPGELGTFGKPGQTLINENLIGTIALIKGDTAYRPPDFEIRLTPVFNFNRFEAEERGVVNIDPAEGKTRNDTFAALQEAFVDYHIRNVSHRYDFDSVRAGIQPFSSDFRGFVFQDDQLGVRLFGNRDNNRWQYNLAYFRRLDKDTNSGLNDITDIRDDDVVVANLYRQDFLVQGYTAQLTWIYNRNREGGTRRLDTNGFTVVPALIGDTRGKNYDVHYLGFNGDGHFGRFNLTHSFYVALGDEDHNQFTGDDKGDDIRAFFAAVEPSIDFDWIRVRLSGLYASGDSDPTDHTATGFDAIYENPIFAGADTSYWIRQGIPLIAGGGITLSPRNGLLPSLRSSKDQGQSNFINPGLFLAGIGADFDLTPELRFSTNFNYLSFANTATLEFLRNQGGISPGIGYDISGAFTYRPGFIQNVVFRLSGAVLLPEHGLKQLYDSAGATDLFSGGKFLYSVLANMVLTY